jgi:hypothetical protein
LKTGGLFIQWLQAYEVEESTVHTVLATARGVFPHVEIWQTLPGDLQLVCSVVPLEQEINELRARMEDDSVQDALTKVWNVAASPLLALRRQRKADNRRATTNTA